jgi:transcriptional regulator with XRE-family HTH domain
MQAIQLSFLPAASDLRDADGSLNLKRIRKVVFNNMTAEDFAHLLGISAATYRSWEYKQREPSGAALSLLKLAAAAPELVQEVLGNEVESPIVVRPKEAGVVSMAA